MGDAGDGRLERFEALSPESLGLDCLACAIFARQGLSDAPTQAAGGGDHSGGGGGWAAGSGGSATSVVSGPRWAWQVWAPPCPVFFRI